MVKSNGLLAALQEVHLLVLFFLLNCFHNSCFWVAACDGLGYLGWSACDAQLLFQDQHLQRIKPPVMGVMCLINRNKR